MDEKTVTTIDGGSTNSPDLAEQISGQEKSSQVEAVDQAASSATTPSLGNAVISLKKIRQLKVSVQAVLGSVPLTVSQLSNLSEGDVIKLNTKIGDPIDVLANGELIGRAEIVVTQDSEPGFGLTLTEIVEQPESSS